VSDVGKAEEVSLPPAGKYEIDATHSTVEFVARYMMVSKVRGRFTEFSGTIEVAETPEDSSLQVEIKAASVQSNVEKRDQHLTSGDFLEVEKYPVLTFTSTAVRRTGDAGFELDGDLTIKDLTSPVTLIGEFLGAGFDMQGEPVFGASAKTTIEREDWDVTWNMALETGGVLVGKSIDIEIEVEARKVG
jgi:polyisoprenoid-binding protein YceI